MIYLLLTDAIEKAKKDPDVEKLMMDGYFLGSVFATAKDSIKEWILHFYSSKKNKVIDCHVGDVVALGEETDALKRMKKLSLDRLKITAETALDTAKEKFKGRTINILITLHRKESVVWTVNMISSALTATTYDIDAETGEIIDENVTSLITRYSRAS